MKEVMRFFELSNNFSTNEIKIVQMYEIFYEKDKLRFLEKKERNNLEEGKVAFSEVKFVAKMIKPFRKQRKNGRILFELSMTLSKPTKNFFLLQERLEKSSFICIFSTRLLENP